jgi:hypothetical protein
MVPLGPSRTALPSAASRTVQFAIPLTSMPGFISVEVCLGATFAFVSGVAGGAGVATGFVGGGAGRCVTGLAIGFAGDGVVGCKTGWVTPGTVTAAA